MPFIDDDDTTIYPPLPTPKRLGTDAFHTLVQELSDVLGPTSGIDSSDVDVQHIIHLMDKYTSNPQHWSRYAFSDPSRNYTRNLVDEGNGKSNLLVLVWNPGKGSPIHDHANAHCIMKILKGKLQETVYALPGDGSTTKTPGQPIPVNETTYTENEVTYISDTIGLHRVINPSETEIAVSLHLYTPPHAANFGFNMFDERTGRATHCRQCEPFSDRGRRVKGA